MKKQTIAIIVLCLVVTVMNIPNVSAAFLPLHNYADEVQLNQFRPHGGDKQEINDFMALFISKVKETAETNKMIAQDSTLRIELEKYIKSLAQYKEIKIESATIDKLYNVEKYDAYNNYRAIVKLKMLCYTNDKKVIEKTDSLGVAKLGKNTTDWKIWGVIWKDSGIDVSDVKLIQLEKPKKGEEICVMTTNAGVIKMRLFPDKAPKAVKNFKELALKAYYNDMPFLRVYNNFMIQGGALDGTEDEGYSIYGHFFEDEFNRDLFNFRGALCMGNVGPTTHGNQFSIVQSPIVDQQYLDLSSLPLNAEAKYKEIGGRAYLDMRYTVFGHVFEGIEAVDKIAAQETDDDGKPLKDPMKILKIEFIKY